MSIHPIYPSSKVSPEEIRGYGWQFVEDIPTITNEAGRLAPTPERSDLHRELRLTIDAEGTVNYSTADGNVFEVRDFAVADSPLTPRALGFFAIK